MEGAPAVTDPAAILRYVAVEEDIPEEEQVISHREEALGLESILKGHEGKKAEISSVVEDEQASEMLNNWLEEIVEEQKRAAIVYYEPEASGSAYEEREEEEEKGSLYVIEDEKEGVDYLFVPRNVSVQRVSQNVLGPGVLGRTWLGSGFIEVLDSLYGDAFQEVLLHEINHLLYPHENEREIRARTRRQVSYPMFH